MPGRPSTLLPTALAVVSAVGAVVGAAAPVAAARAADTVYRCGNQYQQQPCEGGRAVDTVDPRDADQQRQAREAAAADRRLAERLAAERQQRAKAGSSPANATGIPLPAEVRASQPLPDCVVPAGHGKSRPSKKNHRGDDASCHELPVYQAPKKKAPAD